MYAVDIVSHSRHVYGLSRTVYGAVGEQSGAAVFLIVAVVVEVSTCVGVLHEVVFCGVGTHKLQVAVAWSHYNFAVSVGGDGSLCPVAVGQLHLGSWYGLSCGGAYRYNSLLSFRKLYACHIYVTDSQHVPLRSESVVVGRNLYDV